METGIHAMAGHVEQYRNGFSFRKYLCGNVSGYLDAVSYTHLYDYAAICRCLIKKAANKPTA